MSSMRRMIGEMMRYPAMIALALVCLVVVVAADLAVPLLLGRGLFDRVLGAGRMDQLVPLVLMVVGLFVVKGIFHYGLLFATSYVSYRMVTDLRNRVFDHLQRLSVRYHEGRQSGEITSRVTSDLGMVQTIFSSDLYRFLKSFFTLVGVVGVVLYLDWRLSLVSCLTVPLVGYVVSRYGARIRRLAHHAQQKVADTAGILQETLTGIRVVKAFNMERRQRERFFRANENGLMAGIRSARIMAASGPVVEFLMVLGLVMVVWYGALRVSSGVLTSGELIAFLGYIGMLSAPISGLTRFSNLFHQATAAYERVCAVLDAQVEVRERPDARPLKRVEGRIAFHNLSFSYDAASLGAASDDANSGETGSGRNGEEREPEWALRDVSLEVAPGRVMALVGPSGAGKTTLLNLIPRFYDPTHGAVSIDGVDVREPTLESLRSHIGLVPQETILFGGSVAENIAWGRACATESQIVEAAEAANAHDFIEALPDRYETEVGERGLRLSGGQRQRIAIARALLRDPRILLLDEATAALDADSEAVVQDALFRLMAGRTTLVIAHRLSTVRNAHTIAVLDEGRVVEKGHHDELLGKKGVYARLYAKQWGGMGGGEGRARQDGRDPRDPRDPDQRPPAREGASAWKRVM